MFLLARMLRFSLATVCAIAILGLSTNVSAQESVTKFPYLAKVTQKQVAVRAGADSRYYFFGQLFKDDYVQVVAHKSGWAHVRTYGPTFKDFYGYLKLPKSMTRLFIVDSESKTGLTNGSIDIYGPNLDDNAAPARSWKPIARLTSPTELKILDAESTDSLLIFKVELPRESEGWIKLTNIRAATIDEITSWQSFVAQANRPHTVAATEEENNKLASATETMQHPLPIAVNETRTATLDETATKTAEPDATIQETTTVAQQTTSPAGASTPEQTQPRDYTETPNMNDVRSNTDRPEFVETPSRTTRANPSINESISRIAEAIAKTEDQINRPTTNNNPQEPNQVLGTYINPVNPVKVTQSLMRPPASDDTNQRALIEVKPKPKVYIDIETVRVLSLEDLEAMYSKLLRQPKQTAEVDPLRQMYSIYADKFAKEGVEKSHANSRAAQLEIWAELQEKRIQLQAMRSRAKIGVREANEAAITLENSGDYQAVGVLVSSTIYDGKRLPKLFRLRDQITGRTIGYLAPSEDFNLVEMIGEVLGIKGERSYDGGLRLNVFTPQKIDILTNSQ